MPLLTLLDRNSFPSSAAVNCFVLPFVNVRGWTTDLTWKPVGLPRNVFYPMRLIENTLLIAITVLGWKDASKDIWSRLWPLCILGIACNTMLLPMVYLTTWF